MAQRTVTRLIDDVDGTEATETVSYGLDGVQYEIDLNAENAGELRDALAPYICVSRASRPARRRGAALAGGTR